MIRPAVFVSALLLLVSLVVSRPAQAEEIQIPDEVASGLKLSQLKDKPIEFVEAFNRGDMQPADTNRAAVIQRIQLARVAKDRLLIRMGLNQPAQLEHNRFNFYMDVDDDQTTGREDRTHRGVDVAVGLVGGQQSLLFYNKQFSQENVAALFLEEANHLWITFQFASKSDDASWRLRTYGLSQREGGGSSSTPRDISIELPSSKKVAESMVQVNEYRYTGERVQLESLDNKGLRGSSIPRHANFKPGRSMPTLPLSRETPEGKKGNITREKVAVNLLEESGVSRSQTPLRFGFPLPKGALYNSDHVRLLNDAADEMPAQIAATSYWPDGSIKWVLIESLVNIGANEARQIAVEFGTQVNRQQPASPLQWKQTQDVIIVNTGVIRAAINTQKFTLLDKVWRIANANAPATDQDLLLSAAGRGVELVDEHGRLFTTTNISPVRVEVEQAGLASLVLRIEGKYANDKKETYQSYITRLTFYANSDRVDVAHTQINDYLDNEFTDITSLTWPMQVDASEAATFTQTEDGSADLLAKSVAGRSVAVFQANEKSGTIAVDSKETDGGALPGLLQLKTAQGTSTIAVHDFWQRWPKGLHADGNAVRIDLLPKLPSEDFGQDLPHYLRYAFVGGKYRSKWGMAFTERVTFDFSGDSSAQRIYADVQRPIVAVVPGQWYARTDAIGPDALAAQQGKQFSLWDDFVANSYDAHMDLKHANRAFGYYNYGDWYGERGRNWGNNEYDLAQNFFIQFARTGNRDYFHLARAAARHQADVDIVHAYPDPYYIGANHQHSIGHTGTWSQRPEYATWSHRYDSHTSAANGHTWADGMVLAWQIAGEAQVMESAIALGEHITWGMAKDFNHLGDHERTAGWSLRAIMALYRVTSDPVYLDAARHIATVAMSEQDLQGSGVWPHPLPAGHANGRTDLKGNNLFLLGILLGGLKSYHQETGDPAAAQSIMAAAQWMAKSFNEDVGGWPYSAMEDGSAIQKPDTSLNPLIVPGIAYAGVLANDRKLIDIANKALTNLFMFDTQQAMGKDVSIRMYFVPETLALINKWYQQHRPSDADALMSNSSQQLADMLLQTPVPAGFSVRAPNMKIFHVQLQSASEALLAVRSPHGALPAQLAHSTLWVYNQAGDEVLKQTFDPDSTSQIKIPLQGKTGDEYLIAIEDDQRGVWTINASHARVVARVIPSFSIGGVRRSQYTIFVPESTAAFSVHVRGIHSGMYGAALITPDGQVAGYEQGVYVGSAQLRQTGKPSNSTRTLKVEPAPSQRNKQWQLILWANGDISCQIDGIPPVLSLSAEQWFSPSIDPDVLRRTVAKHKQVRIAIIGDSTVSDYDSGKTSMRGWGQLLKAYVRPGRVEIVNLARSGTSSKSFRRLGNWDRVLKLSPRPDYVLIQFGHNDLTSKGPERATLTEPVPATLPSEGMGSHTDDWYRNNLRAYITEARQLGAKPMVVLPMERSYFTNAGEVRILNKPWADAAAAVATEMNVPMVDLNRLSVELLQKLGPDGAVGMHFHRPDGSTDLTHYNETGARIYAQHVAQALAEAFPAIEDAIDAGHGEAVNAYLDKHAEATRPAN